MDQVQFDIIAIAVALASWIIGGIIWLARLEMRVKFLHQTQSECRSHRERTEDQISVKLENIQSMLSTVVNDVSWLKKEGEKNGKVVAPKPE